MIDLVERLRARRALITTDGGAHWYMTDDPDFNCQEAADEIERLRKACAPFLRFYEDIRFNLRKHPRPNEAAVYENGERIAFITWAEFYALNDALSSGK
jgi:hypothetical protein